MFELYYILWMRVCACVCAKLYASTTHDSITCLCEASLMQVCSSAMIQSSQSKFAPFPFSISAATSDNAAAAGAPLVVLEGHQADILCQHNVSLIYCR